MRERLPNVAVTVTTNLQPKRSAEEVAEALPAIVSERKPDLVIWQTGTVDAECVAKALEKLTAGVAKAETKGDCSHLGQTATLANAAGALAEAETCALQPGAPGCDPCGNGFSDVGEPCAGAELSGCGCVVWRAVVGVQ